MNVYNRIILYWEKNPLVSILILAVFFRLIATILARGWGMLDDHFLVIEAAQSWVDGEDYNNWLPGSSGGRVIFYDIITGGAEKIERIIIPQIIFNSKWEPSDIIQ